MDLPWRQWVEHVAMAEFVMRTYRQISFPVTVPKQGTQYVPLTFQVDLDALIPDDDDVAETPRKEMTEKQKQVFTEELNNMQIPEDMYVPGIYSPQSGSKVEDQE